MWFPARPLFSISEARGTKLAPVTTNEAGVYVIPNVTADTYTVEVTMDGFKTVRRQGIKVSGGDRVAVPAMTLEVGGATETVNVMAEAAAGAVAERASGPSRSRPSRSRTCRSTTATSPASCNWCLA